MPLALDDDPPRGSAGMASIMSAGVLLQGASAAAGAQAGFDLQTATTLFWKPVPLLLRQADREEQHEELTFRILTGVLRNNHNMRVLRIHISSETDLFFLHTLEVSEEDFQSLKNEQGILVDFASFPVKIITLLDKCTSAQPTDSPRFQAVLTVRGTESLFRIVETNDFKQLPHITLAFRPGNDAAIKQFLAFRLLEVKADVEELTSHLGKSRGDCDSASSELVGVRQQLAAVQEQYDKHLLEVQADAKTQRASAHEERLKERSELMEAHEREVAEVQRRHHDTVSQLSARLSELDTDNRKLREAKYELDSKVSELSHRLGSSEGAKRSLEDEVARLRTSCAQLGGDRADRDVALQELRAKLGAAEEKVAAQAEVLESQRSRVRDLESGLRAHEVRAHELKEQLAQEAVRAKDAQQEVAKGNQIIDKLTSELRLSKEKSKRKQAILVRQEEELAAREQAATQLRQELAALQQQLEVARGEASSLKAENGELRGRLEDSKQQLQSNEQMIRWLNQQVTEAQLGTVGAHHHHSASFTSRYTPAPLPLPQLTSAAVAPYTRPAALQGGGSGPGVASISAPGAALGGPAGGSSHGGAGGGPGGGGQLRGAGGPEQLGAGSGGLSGAGGLGGCGGGVEVRTPAAGLLPAPGRAGSAGGGGNGAGGHPAPSTTTATTTGGWASRYGQGVSSSSGAANPTPGAYATPQMGFGAASFVPTTVAAATAVTPALQQPASRFFSR